APIALAAEARLRHNLRPRISRFLATRVSTEMALAGDEDPNKNVRRIPAMGRALAYPNFRLFVFGQAISVLGTWMQQIATVWLVYRLSRSPLLLGAADFAAQIPAALILPLAGVLSDRWNRHR